MQVNIKPKSVLSYMFLPGIRPRLRNFSQDGFSSLAVIIAIIYNSVGILPSTHPYLQSNMSGQYGVRHVIAEAGRHLKFSFKHIDQIIIFGAIFAGIVLFAVQFALVLMSFFTKTAQAAGIGNIIDRFWETPQPDQDIALRILDMVFGIPGFFGSEELSYLNVMADFHGALHGMFIIYSMGIIVIGALIVCYFIGAVLIETAETGTPFGKRFNHVWVPVRLIVAFGLLIPISYGMNAGQFITLNAAKWGSGFATNGWLYFNQVATSGGATYLGNRDTLVALPQSPNITHYQAFISLASACNIHYSYTREQIVEAYIVRGTGGVADRRLLANTDFAAALAFSEGRDIHIKIGHFDPTFTEEKGMVKAFCGEMIIEAGISTEEPGFLALQAGYYDFARSMLLTRPAPGVCLATLPNFLQTRVIAHAYVGTYTSTGELRAGRLEELIEEYLSIHRERERAEASNYINSCLLVTQGILQGSPTWNIDPDGLNLGWAGAAIWYNKLAQMNGGFVSASQALPRIHKYPSVMEYVLEQKMQQDDNINPSARFEPQLEQGIAVQFADARDEQLARVFNMIFQFWEEHGYAPEELGSHTRNQNNSLIDAMNAIFGTQGLFDMCRNTDTHPVAQLAAVGKGLIEAAVRNLGFSLASGVMGGAAYILSEHIGAGLSAASGFFSTIAGIGLVIGFILYYIVPFMPFLYFFFAVGGWVKGLFEAMVGVPLWALAHLRIDGEGLPGSSGTYGYFLILEIFLRPFMIMMGLFASITIYSAMVKVLNDIFFLVVSNITGHDPVDRGACTITGSTGLFELGDEMYLRGAIDEFFFTIIYAVIVYMIGMSSFKLIDQIPNEIMRWIGANVKTFNDERAEPAKGLVQRITVGGGAMVGRLQQAASSGTSAVSSGAQGLIEGLRDR